MGVLRILAAECGGTRPNLRLAFFGLLARMLPDNTCAGLRTRLYRLAGIRIGGKVAILGPIRMIGGPDRASRLTIAEGAMIAPRVTIALDAPVTIGRKASIGPGVSLYTAGHGIGFGSCRMDRKVAAKPIVVEDGAWVGLQAIVLPGVTIGHGSVVSAGAVVGSDVPPDTLVAGNPAAEVGKLPFGNR
jgi:acetyltransferase-like isoleucine patch superfamily enzyme